ncbi:MAG: helix-turn-helix domain-containing protein [Gemmatimonadota bacterium]|jgi:AraC-like DNA-binding protein
MLISELHAAAHSLYLFRPPYQSVRPIAPDWLPGPDIPHGEAIVWCISGVRDSTDECTALMARRPGMPLIVILPPPEEIAGAYKCLQMLHELRAKGVLPYVEIDAVSALRSVLYAPPVRIGQSLSSYLAGRGLLNGDALRGYVSRIFDLAPQVRSVSKLSSALCMSRRTLGRHFAAAGLPVPSHWLQFARLLHAIFQLQRNGPSVFHVACKLGYPDGFTMSNQMKRILGLRPSEIRGVLGWEWIVERWLRRERCAVPTMIGAAG